MALIQYSYAQLAQIILITLNYIKLAKYDIVAPVKVRHANYAHCAKLD
jgi:hypothetical protein